MAYDVTVILDDRPGELARLGEVAGAAGVNIEGFAAFTGESKGVVHVLVADDRLETLRDAFTQAGMPVADEREVFVVNVADEPGALGEVARRLADANVNVDLAYTTFGGVRLVFGTDDVSSAREALDFVTQSSSLLDLLPPGTELTDDGVPVVAGCRLDQVAAETATPVFVVAEDALRARAREYADGLAARWPRSRVVFASKAFPCTAVQRVMVEEGLGLDVAGGGEILGALKAGVDPRLVVLHGNAKLPEEIALAVEHDLGLVVVDGPDDVDRLEATVAGRVVDVLVRVIPGVTAETHDSVLTGHDDSKFGLAPEEAEPLIRRIEASGKLRMRGLHLHVGSQILETEPFAEAVAAVARLGEFPVYDLGGGLGARYTWSDEPPSVTAYLDTLVEAARVHLPAEAELIVEPGRSMVAAGACTVYSVVTVKRGKHTFVAVDGGMGDNLEVALFGQRFEAGIVGRLDAGDELCQLVGRHCESGDVLVRDVLLARPVVGDLVVVPVTGAYCFTMSNNYNGNRRPPVVFARDGSSRTVVRRGTWQDLLSRDVG